VAGHLALASGRLAAVLRRRGLAGFAVPLTAPRTSLNHVLTPRRGYAFCSLPLGPVKRLARQEGLTVNDVVLAMTGGALRRYLADRGEAPGRSLIAAVPVSLAGHEPAPVTGGNRWAVMPASLGTDVADPVARLRRVAASANTGKVAQQAVGEDLWQELVDVAPAALHLVARGYARLGLAEHHPPLVNVVVSDLRGAPFALYFAGVPLLGGYPVGPVADGFGLNVTVISYQDSLDFGLTVCPDLVPDPWLLVDALRAESAELSAEPARCPAPAGPLVPTPPPGPVERWDA
jgi:WS/DGAT/MGAT family acyltransferase